MEEVAGVVFLRRAKASVPVFESNQVPAVNGFMRTSLVSSPVLAPGLRDEAPDAVSPNELVGVVGVGDSALVLLADGRSAPADEAKSERWGWSYRVGSEWFSWRYRVPRALVVAAPAVEVAGGGAVETVAPLGVEGVSKPAESVGLASHGIRRYFPGESYE